MRSGSSVAGLGKTIEFASAKFSAGGSAFGTLGFRPGEVVALMTSAELIMGVVS